MQFHLPKPLHGWREFAGEVGIIVIGVLIALGASQLVEEWQWRQDATQARAALRAELGEDNLPQAYARRAIAPCLEVQAKQVQDAVDGHADRRVLAPLTQAYDPPSRTWDNETWKAVVATGVLAHGGAGELVDWSFPYRVIAAVGPINDAESEDRENLTSISSQPGPLTAAELDRVTVALEHLRRDRMAMNVVSQVLTTAAKHAGVELSAAQKRTVLDDLRPTWGKCMIVPVDRNIDIQRQNEAQLRH